jgi:glycosyltransferase involved in cell wall biosynthesis
MKVTFLLTDARLMSGGQRVLAQMAAHLAAQGHGVTLISSPRDTRVPLRERIGVLLGRRVPRLKMPPFEGSHFHAAGLEVIWTEPGAKIAAAQIPDGDAVITSWWECAEWMNDLPPEKGRQVHLIQDRETFPYLPLDRVEAVYRHPRAKIAIAGWLQRTMREDFGADADLAPNGVDAAWFDAAPRGRGAPLTVGFLFSPAPRKNVGLAVAALELARARIPGLRAVAFGAHDHGGALPDWIDYEIRPAQNRIREIYASCDAWLFPSASEGFGLPILEAMGCRTPVLATHAGAAPDLIEDGVNGRLLPDEPEAFAAALVDLSAADPADWAAMSAAARATAEANDLPRAMARFEAALTRIVAGGTAG